MSSTTNDIQVQNLDHLGFVAGIIDELGLVEQVDELLGMHPQAVVTLGQVWFLRILWRTLKALFSSHSWNPLSVDYVTSSHGSESD